jgi:hypothetical protein
MYSYDRQGDNLIDKIVLKRQCTLDIARFDTRRFTYTPWIDTDIEYRIYKYNFSGVNITYSTRSHMLKLEGRLINLSAIPNKVDTLDLLWAGVEYSGGNEYQNLEDIINRINNKLWELTGYRMDVCRFTVSYIEACFNIHTEHVGEYLYMFNDIFCLNNKSRYTNYISVAKKDWRTGFYIKTNKDYSNNSKHNFVLNFYDKYNELYIMKQENRAERYVTVPTDNDLERSRGILRLEIQCGYNYLRSIKRKQLISGQFQDFLNIDLCHDLIVEKYKAFVDKYTYCDFHTYGSAFSLIQDRHTLSIKKLDSLRKYCVKLSQRRNTGSSQTQKKYEDMLEGFNIHSVFIQPKRFGSVSFLRSPIALLNEHIQNIKEQRQSYIDRHGAQQHISVEEDIENNISDIDFFDMVDTMED